jgi:hypothetical protein
MVAIVSGGRGIDWMRGLPVGSAVSDNAAVPDDA